MPAFARLRQVLSFLVYVDVALGQADPDVQDAAGHAAQGAKMQSESTLVKAVAALAIDLIRGDIYEAPDAPIDAAGFQQHVRAICIVDCERQAVAEAVVHMRLHCTQRFANGLTACRQSCCSRRALTTQAIWCPSLFCSIVQAGVHQEP